MNGRALSDAADSGHSCWTADAEFMRNIVTTLLFKTEAGTEEHLDDAKDSMSILDVVVGAMQRRGVQRESPVASRQC